MRTETKVRSEPAQTPVVLRCMEVWGGNQRTFRKVELQGLDVWIAADPMHDDGGGDVHYLSSCSTGRIIRILVADVSGHGEEASRVAEDLAKLMRRHVNTFDQNRFIRDLSGEFGSIIEGGQFATAVAATYFAPTRELEVTIAGHPRPLLLRGSAGDWMPMDGPEIPEGRPANIPLGILEHTYYYSHASQLGMDDVVLFYSDAVIEAARPDGTQLGERGLLDLAAGLDASDPEAFLRELVRALEQWRAAPLEDDETLVVFRRNEADAEMGPVAVLRSIWTLARGTVRAAIKGEPIPVPRLGSYFQRNRS